jgi:phage regulator Rha-like protein
MEKYEELRDIAGKKIQIADHMLTMTYPMVKDPKLLLAVMENIFLALTNSVGSLLHYERIYKRVPPFQDTFVSKFNVFKQKCAKRLNIDNETILMIHEIKEIILQHKKSPVEFTRNNSFIICSEDYRMKTITLEKMKNYILKSRLFVQNINNIINKNQLIFNKATRNF